MNDEYPAPTPFLAAAHPDVQAYAAATAGAGDDRARAVRLFYAVRDDIRYNPYVGSLDAEAYGASRVLAAREGFCVQKAIVLAACGRSLGIPTRLGFADVRNHLSSRRLRDIMRTDLFVFHGFTELWLGGRWVKATPTFNRSLCERFGVLPLEFDGVEDALLQPYDAAGKRHMEYVKARGSFADFPLADMVAAFREAYPHFFGGPPPPTGDFQAQRARGPHPG